MTTPQAARAVGMDLGSEPQDVDAHSAVGEAGLVANDCIVSPPTVIKDLARRPGDVIASSVSTSAPT